jgi:hypothetical protein
MEKKYPYELVFTPCAENDQRAVGSYTSHDGESHCNVREMYVPSIKQQGAEWVQASSRLPVATTPPRLFIVKWQTIGGNYMVRYMTANQLADLFKCDIVLQHEWLDETSTAMR